MAVLMSSSGALILSSQENKILVKPLLVAEAHQQFLDEKNSVGVEVDSTSSGGMERTVNPKNNESALVFKKQKEIE